MKKKYLIELAELIPARNINFYLDTCNAMSVVDLREIETSDEPGIEPGKLQSLVIDGGTPQAVMEMMMDYLTCTGMEEKPAGMRLLGYVMLNNVLQQEDRNGEKGPLSRLPFIFTGYAMVKDLLFSGYGPNYSFVGRLLVELAEDKIISACISENEIEKASRRYTPEDMAAVFLGYSLASNGSRGPLVPFPQHPTGFSASLRREMAILLPRTCVENGLW